MNYNNFQRMLFAAVLPQKEEAATCASSTDFTPVGSGNPTSLPVKY